MFLETRTPALCKNYYPTMVEESATRHPTSTTLWASTHLLLCKHVSSWFAVLFGQQQVVEFDDNVGKVSEVHKVRGDDVDPVRPRPLSLNPGHDGWQVSRRNFVLEGER